VDGLVIQPYDLLMLAVLVGMAVFGAVKGMAWQVAAIGSVVISCFVAVKFGPLVAPYFSAAAPWNQFIAMLVLYLGTSLAIWMFFRVVSKIIDQVKLKDFDRQIGATFGLARGVLYCLVITFFAVTLSETSRQAVLRSRSGYYAAVLIQRGAPMLPDEVREVLGRYIDELDRKLDPNTPSKEAFAGEADKNGSGAGEMSPIATEPAGEERPKAWDPALWREDAQAVLDERIDELNRRAGDEIGRRLEESSRAVHEAVSRRLEEVGSRIERRPLVPVQP
jgi:membrane protein required for colicin V production